MFDIVTPLDFYRMAVEDFDDFLEEPHSARRAMHCAISAYHLHDWVWAGWLVEDPLVRDAIGIERRKKDFVDWLRRTTWLFRIVEELANGSKHFRPSEELEALKVVAAPFQFGTFGAGFGEGVWGGPVRYVSSSMPVGPKGQGYLLIDLGEGAGSQQFMPAAHVFEGVVRMWRDFFQHYSPVGTDVPCSRNHAL